jgi:hypothetical protein
MTFCLLVHHYCKWSRGQRRGVSTILNPESAAAIYGVWAVFSPQVKKKKKRLDVFRTVIRRERAAFPGSWDFA